MKTLKYITIAILILAGAGVTAFSASPIGLKQDVVVNDSTLKLGDLFTGLTRDNDRVLGAAPAPGQSMTLNARTLMRIAIAMNLSWRPQSNTEQVIVKREATTVNKDYISDQIKTALLNKGVTGNYSLNTESLKDIILPADAAPTAEVTEITFQPENNWFEATIVAPSKTEPLSTARISGKIQRVTSVPVLRGALSAGTIIGERDIDYIEMNDNALHANLIVDPAKLIGTTPRRMITPGQPIKLTDIEQPRVVSRGGLITMVFKSGTLTLTAEGKALEDGAAGDTIRVVNTSSNKTLQGLVTGSNEVTLLSER